MPIKKDAVVERLMAIGVPDDDIAAVLDNVDRHIGSLIDKGMTDKEIEANLAQSPYTYKPPKGEPITIKPFAPVAESKQTIQAAPNCGALFLAQGIFLLTYLSYLIDGEEYE